VAGLFEALSITKGELWKLRDAPAHAWLHRFPNRFIEPTRTKSTYVEIPCRDRIFSKVRPDSKCNISFSPRIAGDIIRCPSPSLSDQAMFPQT